MTRIHRFSMMINASDSRIYYIIIYKIKYGSKSRIGGVPVLRYIILSVAALPNFCKNYQLISNLSDIAQRKLFEEYKHSFL